MENVLDVLVPFTFIAAADPDSTFVGYFFIADQNLSGEEALCCNRSLKQLLLHFFTWLFTL